MDAFFASVEQLDHPQWRGLALAVGGGASRGGVSCLQQVMKLENMELEAL